ncbi:MAG: ribonuclease E/G [Candidatus Pelagibacter sp.]|nr:ribonuclease E/G [Candidatus Pelagibacter sp.]OUV87367.1 MAG: ribonuclease E/G [Pelagibacteraceae bacterium TMED136]|tara:strand:- start:11449 stop:13233 length:1785 start_codon:yes stop_codon:yes gene_type:complete
MEKKILIDASQAKQTRIAITNNGNVDGYEFENINKKQLKGNIYLGKVSRVEPSLQAAFVDFGNERHGFLAFNDIQSDYYHLPQVDKNALKQEEEEIREELNKVTENIDANENKQNNEILNVPISESENIESTLENGISDNENHLDKKIEKIKEKRKKRYRIQEVIKPGQVILIQIVKEERGKKGAALTTYISLAGKYIVLMPNTAKGGGISRKIFNTQDRRHIREIINKLSIPNTMGLIVRTAGAKKTQNDITNDLGVLIGMWEKIKHKTLNSNAPSLIHEEGDLIYRAIRDFLTNDIKEIIIDGKSSYEKALSYAETIAGDYVKKIKRYKNKIPLFHSSGIEKYLNIIFESKITLKSGGYLIINPTEALVAIDVNSGKSTKERNIEKTALATNIEAAEEIARQAKLRDLAGLIVVDFIDMENFSNRRLVERKMKESLRTDKARTQVGRISHFGLLEMTRQRLRESYIKWETVLSKESFCEKLLRKVEEKIFDIPKVKKVSIEISPKTILFMKENMKEEINFFEKKFKFKSLFLKNENLLSNEFKVNFLNSKNKLLDTYSEISIQIEETKKNKSIKSDGKKKTQKKFKKKKVKK